MNSNLTNYPLYYSSGYQTPKEQHLHRITTSLSIIDEQESSISFLFTTGKIYSSVSIPWGGKKDHLHRLRLRRELRRQKSTTSTAWRTMPTSAQKKSENSSPASILSAHTNHLYRVKNTFKYIICTPDVIRISKKSGKHTSQHQILTTFLCKRNAHCNSERQFLRLRNLNLDWNTFYQTSRSVTTGKLKHLESVLFGRQTWATCLTSCDAFTLGSNLYQVQRVQHNTKSVNKTKTWWHKVRNRRFCQTCVSEIDQNHGSKLITVIIQFPLQCPKCK